MGRVQWNMPSSLARINYFGRYDRATGNPTGALSTLGIIKEEVFGPVSRDPIAARSALDQARLRLFGARSRM